MAKRKFFAVAIVAVLVLLLGGSAHAMELSGGFSGILWGSQASEQIELVPVGKKGKVDYYINPQVVHTIGDISVSDEVYGFYEGRFFAVYFNIDSVEAYGLLKDELNKMYGEPEISMTMKSQETIYKWKLQGVKIKLKIREATGHMKLAFYYLAGAESLNEAELEAHQEKGLRFLPIERGGRPKMMPLLEF